MLANTAPEKDPHLDLTEALAWSRAQIDAHQRQFTQLTEQCQQWEQRRRKGAMGVPPKFVVTRPNEKLIWEGQRLELVAKIEVNLFLYFEFKNL